MEYGRRNGDSEWLSNLPKDPTAGKWQMWNSSPLRLGPESKHDELSFLQKSTVLLYEGKTISGKETEQL